MRSHVGFEIVGLAKAFFANAALIRFFTRVRFLVGTQIVTLNEPFAAGLTLERLFACNRKQYTTHDFKKYD
jgi:hypothetical protein